MNKWVIGLAVSASLGSIVSLADAADVIVDFPSSNTSYFSATNGSGTIPSGGQSAYMWTKGDYVTQALPPIALSSVDSLSVDFQYQNILGYGATETVEYFINGTPIGSFTAPDTNFSESDLTITDTLNFGSITGNGNYTLSMVLENTVAGGSGSIAFLDGGQFTLGGQNSSVPEPATMVLFGTGLIGLAGLVRRKKA